MPRRRYQKWRSVLLHCGHRLFHRLLFFDLREKTRARLRLAQLRLDELAAGVRDLFALVRMREVILAAGDEILRLHHDEVPARHEFAVAFAGLGDDAAAVREADEHAVPLEIFLLRVVDVEQDAGIAEQLVATLDR